MNTLFNTVLKESSEKNRKYVKLFLNMGSIYIGIKF